MGGIPKVVRVIAASYCAAASAEAVSRAAAPNKPIRSDLQLVRMVGFKRIPLLFIDLVVRAQTHCFIIPGNRGIDSANMDAWSANEALLVPVRHSGCRSCLRDRGAIRPRHRNYRPGHQSP